MISDKNIHHGIGFDWGKASSDYAQYRDIYPQYMYGKLISPGLCNSGQNILDIGTSAGVFPLNLYSNGANFTGTDASGEQILQAK